MPVFPTYTIIRHSTWEHSLGARALALRQKDVYDNKRADLLAGRGAQQRQRGRGRARGRGRGRGRAAASSDRSPHQHQVLHLHRNRKPTLAPAMAPTLAPALAPTLAPARAPARAPTRAPALAPTRAPAACEPGTRAASATGWQPPARRRGRGASPGAGRGHRPPNPAAQGPSWTPRTTPIPTVLLTGPRGRTAANIAASGPSDRAAGRGERARVLCQARTARFLIRLAARRKSAVLPGLQPKSYFAKRVHKIPTFFSALAVGTALPQFCIT
jgi:hypothetical protein